MACQPRPKAHNYRACGRPGEGAPTWSKETSQQMLRPGNRTGDITYIHTREGFVYPACRHRAASSKKIVGYAIAEHMRTELVQNAPENWRSGTAEPSRV